MSDRPGPARGGHAPLYIAADPAPDSFRRDVLAGLAGRSKSLPAKYLYDARGSALFDEITRLPEYYPTRAELEILSEQAAALAAFLPAAPMVVEFGAGSSRKFRLLMAALGNVSCYVPVDISPDMLFEEARALKRACPGLAVHPVVADFTAAFARPPVDPSVPVVGFFPGSTIGNFEPHDASAFLGMAAATLGPGSSFVVGVDLIKERAILEAAYNDAAGITAAFNRNILTRINRELAGTFNPDFFRHLSFFNDAERRIEMHLESLRPQVVRVAGVPVRFSEGERIHTENSYKYTVRGFQRLAREAGWIPLAVLLDRAGAVSVHILRHPLKQTVRSGT